MFFEKSTTFGTIGGFARVRGASEPLGCDNDILVILSNILKLLDHIAVYWQGLDT